MSGMRTSDSTTSGAATSSIASARCGPSATRTSVVPLSASASASEVRMVGSSSTIRRRRGIWVVASALHDRLKGRAEVDFGGWWTWSGRFSECKVIVMYRNDESSVRLYPHPSSSGWQANRDLSFDARGRPEEETVRIVRE